MLSFSMLFLNELVKTKQNDLCLRVLRCLTLKWEKHSLEVKKIIVLQKKKELGDLVEKYKKEYNKEYKLFDSFLCKRCLLGQTKRKGTLYPNSPTPPLPPLIIFYTNSQPPAY